VGEWLLDPKPDALIVSTGWHGTTVPRKKVVEISDCEVHILKNEEAIELYNRLKKSGKKVAVHYHSTC
jgi:hypothetical protein